jgi:Ala-tRNA(Pro) deacylase
MGIAITLQRYLDGQNVAYDCVEHRRTSSAAQSAEICHVSTARLAKAVVLKRREGYILAIVPASRRVALDEVGSWLRQTIGLATEAEIASLFPDCEPGAVPPIAAAYGVRALVDESLEGQGDIYFEGGDHRTLVHVSGEHFHMIMEKVPHGRISSDLGIGEDELYYNGA